MPATHTSSKKGTDMRTVTRYGRWALTAAMMCTCVALPVDAAADTQNLIVTARVREHIRLRVLGHPGHFEVTVADILRRYVEIPEPLRIEVVSNLTRGVSMQFVAQDPGIRSVRARSPVSLAPSRRGMQTEVLDVFLRLDLDDTARPGRHNWSIQVAMESP